jgi:hypothetical protein
MAIMKWHAYSQWVIFAYSDLEGNLLCKYIFILPSSAPHRLSLPQSILEDRWDLIALLLNSPPHLSSHVYLMFYVGFHSFAFVGAVMHFRVSWVNRRPASVPRVSFTKWRNYLEHNHNSNRSQCFKIRKAFFPFRFACFKLREEKQHNCKFIS